MPHPNPPDVIIREIQHGSPDYELEVELRTKVLREPLGLKYSPEQLAKEIHDIHLGAFKNEKLLGCLLLTPVDEEMVKMRQVAVDSSVQGQGIGRLLVSAFERRAKQMRFTKVELHARETAVPFYLSLNYEVFGESFIEVTLSHRKMRKAI